MKKTQVFISMLTATMLTACATGSMNIPSSFDLSQDELSSARKAIAAAKAAGAESCAPKMLAKAESALYQAAHELTEGRIHPDETSGLITDAEAMGKKARHIAMHRCEAMQGVHVLHVISFSWNNTRLSPTATAVLDTAVATLKKHSRIRIEVAGHTDSTGDDSYNLALSQRRSKNVYAYLVAHGIAAKRLSAKGYGESQPAISNRTAAGRARNRRVELRVLK